MHQFFITYSDDVYRYLISRCSDELIANDILNQVMMTVWNGSSKFEGRSKLTTWLISIARCKLIDHYRRESKHNHDEINDDMSGSYSDDGEGVEHKEQNAILRTCVDKLVEIQREIVHLTFYSDMNYHEIANVIECPVGTVKSRMYHARESMRQCIESLSAEESYCGI
jgi:RNA polymerase sigma-70 factor (ECF subfamily)